MKKLSAAIIAVSFFAAAMSARAAGEVATFREWGVCIDAPDSSYSIEANMAADFYIVDESAAEGHRMRIYIGNYPQLDRAAIETARRTPGVLAPVWGQPTQFVAVEPEPGNLILHVMMNDVGEVEREHLLAGVRFCPRDGA